jgi:hypothetical protein
MRTAGLLTTSVEAGTSRHWFRRCEAFLEVVPNAGKVVNTMQQPASKADGAARRVRVAALLLIVGLAAGPAASHLYWMLGGTWGLHQSTSIGIRVVAAVVLVLLIAAVLVVLARVGLWRQAFVSDRMIRFFVWVLAAIFLLETLASMTWGRGHEWWLYGPVSLVIGLLAVVVASSGGGRPRFHRPHRTLTSH